MSFNVGDFVFVGNSLYPAKIVRIVYDTCVEVDWLDNAGTNWERIHPLSIIKPMEGRRTRTKTKIFTEGEKENNNEKGAAPKKAPKKRTKTSTTAAKPNPRRKLIATKPKLLPVKKSRPVSMKPPPCSTSKPSDAQKPAPKKRRIMAHKTTGTTITTRDYSSLGQSVARLPSTDDDDDDSSSSDEELLAEARRSLSKRCAIDHDEDDRKPAAKPIVRLDLLSSSSDESSDDHDLYCFKSVAAQRRGKHERNEKSAAKCKRRNNDSSSDDLDSSDDNVDLARTRARRAAPKRRKHNNDKKPPAKLKRKQRSRDEGELDGLFSSSSSDDDDGSSDDSENEAAENNKESTNDKKSATQESPNCEEVKAEPGAAPTRHTFVVGDHVWAPDGQRGKEKYPAIVTKDVDYDSLEVQWADGYKIRKIVPKNLTSLMFDLTEDAADAGRPRRSTRARRKPKELINTAPVKKEKKSKMLKKNDKLSRRTRSKTKKVASKPKRMVARTKSKKLKVDASDTDTETESSVHYTGTKIEDPVLLLDSSKDESDLDSVSSEATFEYTAPHVDPKFRSLHAITSLDDFMEVKPWNQKSGISHEHNNTVEDEMDDSARDERIQADNSSDEFREEQKGDTQANDCDRLSLDKVPSPLDTVPEITGGEPSVSNVPPPSPGVQARAVSLYGPYRYPGVDEENGRRQSNETANPDELPDILLPNETEPTANEDRLTADTQELSQAFAAFGKCALDVSF